MRPFVLALALIAAAGLQGAAQDAHQRGVDLYKQQKYPQAIAALEQTVSLEAPGSKEYQESALLIGQSYFQLGQAPKAIPWLEKVPNVNEANYMLGYAYLQANRQNDSVAAFARLFGLPPRSAAAHLLAGQMMLKKEYESQAEDQLKQAVTLDPKLPEVHFVLGEIAIYRGKLDEALADLQTELQLNPNFSMAWYRLGDVYTRQELWDQAIPDLQRAIWLNPDFSGPFILLGKCYFKTQNYANAEGILRRALELDPRNASAIYLLGQTLILEGKKDDGRAMLDRWKALQAPQSQ